MLLGRRSKESGLKSSSCKLCGEIGAKYCTIKNGMKWMWEKYLWVATFQEYARKHLIHHADKEDNNIYGSLQGAADNIGTKI